MKFVAEKYCSWTLWYMQAAVEIGKFGVTVVTSAFTGDHNSLGESAMADPYK
jgi:hypothetical protein